MVPISLFTIITETKTVFASSARAKESRSIAPALVAPIRLTRKPSASNRSAAANTALCSNAPTTTPSPTPAARAARAAPSTARLSDSVPPPVKITSLESAPKALATCSRASSSAVLADRAAA
ncbi:unannotated protein [freshwater metagenome]|uniref:Unannotated protein n=1 Tax=freshwater metagenome TaxID=449393 RepID=A0A6J7RT43_9ZZZZ